MGEIVFRLTQVSVKPNSVKRVLLLHFLRTIILPTKVALPNRTVIRLQPMNFTIWLPAFLQDGMCSLFTQMYCLCCRWCWLRVYENAHTVVVSEQVSTVRLTTVSDPYTTRVLLLQAPSKTQKVTVLFVTFISTKFRLCVSVCFN